MTSSLSLSLLHRWSPLKDQRTCFSNYSRVPLESVPLHGSHQRQPPLAELDQSAMGTHTTYNDRHKLTHTHTHTETSNRKPLMSADSSPNPSPHLSTVLHIAPSLTEQADHLMPPLEAGQCQGRVPVGLNLQHVNSHSHSLQHTQPLQPQNHRVRSSVLDALKLLHFSIL